MGAGIRTLINTTTACWADSSRSRLHWRTNSRGRLIRLTGRGIFSRRWKTAETGREAEVFAAPLEVVRKFSRPRSATDELRGRLIRLTGRGTFSRRWETEETGREAEVFATLLEVL